MRTFFRHLRQRLLTEKRLSKYLLYALGEIILIVAGILLAMQINNWNEYRKERVREQHVLKQLRAEYLYNKEELNRNIFKANRIIGNADTLLLQFHSLESVADLTLAEQCVRRLTGYPTFDASDGALNDLINSGNLEIIRNDSLRILLSKWKGLVYDVKEDELRLMDFGDTHLVPIRLKYLKYAPASRFRSDVRELLKNRELENIVFSIGRHTDYLLNTNYQMLDKDIEAILTLINEQLME